MLAETAAVDPVAAEAVDTVDGLAWTCYLGQRAVDEGILSADLLGQYSPSPGRR